MGDAREVLLDCLGSETEDDHVRVQECLAALEAAGLRVCAEGQANLGGVVELGRWEWFWSDNDEPQLAYSFDCDLPDDPDDWPFYIARPLPDEGEQ